MYVAVGQSPPGPFPGVNSQLECQKQCTSLSSLFFPWSLRRHTFQALKRSPERNFVCLFCTQREVTESSLYGCCWKCWRCCAVIPTRDQHVEPTVNRLRVKSFAADTGEVEKSLIRAGTWLPSKGLRPARHFPIKIRSESGSRQWWQTGAFCTEALLAVAEAHRWWAPFLRGICTYHVILPHRNYTDALIVYDIPDKLLIDMFIDVKA